MKDWLAGAKHPRFKRPYTELVYQPMLEVMRYLRANGFKTYIVTGGGQEFVRVLLSGLRHPPEQVIGSPAQTEYGYAGRQAAALQLPGSCSSTTRRASRRISTSSSAGSPIAAFGNSTGDRQMLEWTQSGAGARLMMLVHHDDADARVRLRARSRRSAPSPTP